MLLAASLTLAILLPVFTAEPSSRAMNTSSVDVLADVMLGRASVFDLSVSGR